MKQLKKDITVSAPLWQFIILVVSIVILICQAIYLIGYQHRVITRLTPQDGDSFSQMITTMTEIDNIFNEYSVLNDDEVNESDILVANAIKAYAASYGDRYMGYIDPIDFDEVMINNNSGSTSTGLTVVWERDIEKYYIAKVESGSPADKKGIKEGEYLVSINGTTLTNENYNSQVNDVPAKSGVDVVYGIEKSNGDIEIVEMIKEVVHVESVLVEEISDDTAYVEITAFQSDTDEQFIRIMDDLSNLGINKIIIDLRNNHGGLAESVIRMIDYMCPDGLIMELKDGSGEITETHYSNKKEYNKDAEIVVLINEETASASELFTQCMKDFNKATVVGVQSFGKGTVVTELQLSNGGGLVLSTSRYYTKSGVQIEGNGVMPDYEVDLTDDQKSIYYKLDKSEDAQIQKAIEILSEAS